MSDNIQEAEVGSGTKVADTKKSEKRAQLTLKSIQLRLKQEKERAALQQQKKSLQVKEEIKESFSPSQIAALKAEYSKINTIDPSSDTYKKLIAMLDRLDLKSLKSLAGAEIKFVSKLAQNRVARQSMKEEVQLDELSNDKLADYKKKAGADASAADKAGDIKKGNKRFSGIMKATRKQFDNDAKQKTEELSPKQKALDKNKNGKIDGSDLAKLRGEELSAKQKVLDKNKNGKIDGSDLAALRNKKKPQGADFAAQRRKERLASNGRMDEESINEKSDYEIYHKDYSTAVQTAIKQAEKRGYEVDMDDWHDKVATGPKKPSSGKTNSFSINLMKDGKPSKKKLQMQVYNMDNHKYELNMYIESVEEASSPAQQAAIAIAMKKAGKKPKDMEESDAYDKDVKPSDKPHDKEAAAKRAKIAAIAARKKMAEDWSKKYKDSIDCSNPKGFSQKAHCASKKKVSESIVATIKDKLNKLKRGNEAQQKADNHFDKAGDPKNANASKDLKKAVRYHNLLNKEQINPEAKKLEKGQLTKSGVAKWLAEPMKKEEKVPEFKQGGSELAKKFNKAFKANGVDAKVKIRTVGNVSANEEVVLEAKKKTFKDVKKKMKEEENPSKTVVQKGDQLTGKKEPIQLNPELKS